MRQHKSSVHRAFDPQPCEDGCFGGKIFNNLGTYLAHRRTHHEVGWQSPLCPFHVPDDASSCPRTEPFVNRVTMRSHLIDAHKKTKAEATSLMPVKVEVPRAKPFKQSAAKGDAQVTEQQ